MDDDFLHRQRNLASPQNRSHRIKTGEGITGDGRSGFGLNSNAKRACLDDGVHLQTVAVANYLFSFNKMDSWQCH